MWNGDGDSEVFVENEEDLFEKMFWHCKEQSHQEGGQVSDLWC